MSGRYTVYLPCKVDYIYRVEAETHEEAIRRATTYHIFNQGKVEGEEIEYVELIGNGISSKGLGGETDEKFEEYICDDVFKDL